MYLIPQSICMYIILYYTVLLYMIQVFDELHISEEDAAVLLESQSKETVTPTSIGWKLHCYNVWYSTQLPWNAELVKEATNCAFSVIQSSTGVSPSSILALYNKYIY